MKLRFLQIENELTVYIEGRLDTVTAPELEQALAPYYDSPTMRMNIDCADMSYISSAGLRVVLMAHKNMAQKGGSMVMKNLCKEVRTVFELTGFIRIIKVE